ncbi:MAG: hypothetical protein EXQ55_09050 [Acidobacteria bacterium]|nr:hypothetical protein [Acidobacteriota bacterium]
MKGIVGFGGIVLALGIGYFVYTRSLTTRGGTELAPQEQIDVVGIRANLLTIGQAERMYLAAHGSYGTLEQLRQEGPSSIQTDNRGYVFSVSVNGAQSFRATAIPADPNKAGWPTLEIDDTTTVTER